MSDSVTPWTVACQAPLSTGFCRQEHWLLLLLSRFSRVRLCATPWTAARQAPLSTGLSRREYWSGLLFPSPVCVYTYIKRKSNLDICDSMGGIMLSEISQIEKDKYCICVVQTKQKQTQRYREQTGVCQRWGVGEECSG